MASNKFRAPTLATVSMLSLGCTGSSDEADSVIALYLSENYPGVTLVLRQDIDIASCGTVDSEVNVGLIAVDFDGNEFADYAVLGKGPVEDYVYDGETYKVRRISFLVLLGNVDGFDVGIERQSVSGLPTAVLMEKASVSQALPIGQKEHLSNPPLERITHSTDEGVIVTYCEKSSALYFWDGHEVVEYFLTD